MLNSRRYRFIRFLIVGGLNTLFGFAVYSALIFWGSPDWVALIGSNGAGIIFNFITTGGFVFMDLAIARFPRFAAFYLSLYFLNLLLIKCLVPIVGGAIAAQAILVIPIALLSYFGMARIVFYSDFNV